MEAKAVFYDVFRVLGFELCVSWFVGCFMVEDLGFRVWDSEFRVQGLELKCGIKGSGFRF